MSIQSTEVAAKSGLVSGFKGQENKHRDGYLTIGKDVTVLIMNSVRSRPIQINKESSKKISLNKSPTFDDALNQKGHQNTQKDFQTCSTFKH